MSPPLSAHFQKREPSDIRRAQIEFARRTDGCTAVNVAIGNVSLPMHPAMQARLRELGTASFRDGAVPYTATVGTDECRRAFLHAIASSGGDSAGLHAQVTDGGSQAMELVALGCCGDSDRPLLLIEPAYTNWAAMAERTGRRVVSVRRTLQPDGRFTLPDLAEIERVIERERPGAMVVIPYDNPTGQLVGHAAMKALASLCVKHDLWFVSDEAYRELFYADGDATSAWRLSDVPGLRGRRISIETASKVWNACGLRIGALVTDSEELHRRSVAEQTANLCASAIGQHVFAAIAGESHDALRRWYDRQRSYYRELVFAFTREVRERVPGIVVSSPDAAIYSVVDVRAAAGDNFDALAFVTWCAREGRVDVDGAPHTLLTAPMAGFYRTSPGEPNPGRTQMRIAYVETPARMKLVPRLFAELLAAYGRA
jgi:aspartate aminotransferase